MANVRFKSKILKLGNEQLNTVQNKFFIDKTGMNLLIFLKMLEPTVNWDK